MTAPRIFQDTPAVRSHVPLFVGLCGPSGSGKTFSALRLATGIQRVSGGDIYFIDTESNRALHYADKFRFRHLPFGEPFGSLDYLAAFKHCVAKGAKVIVVDSISHEHEGVGGVLDQHERILDRMAGNDYAKRQRCSMTAWAEPKAGRRALVNGILQMNCNFVFCFRAKEKIKPVKGGEPIDLGWQAIAGDEFAYEMTVRALLLPGAAGVPTWNPERVGERELVKLPDQFKALATKPGPLGEGAGEWMARWASGAPMSAEKEQEAKS